MTGKAAFYGLIWIPYNCAVSLNEDERVRVMAELPYRIVVGLEVHVQLLTKTKLFCGCLNKFGLPPNSATCPVCLGMPGVLPVMNRKAYELALKAAMALYATASWRYGAHMTPSIIWEARSALIHVIRAKPMWCFATATSRRRH